MDWPTGRVRGRKSAGSGGVGFQDVSRSTRNSALSATSLTSWARIGPGPTPRSLPVVAPPSRDPRRGTRPGYVRPPPEERPRRPQRDKERPKGPRGRPDPNDDGDPEWDGVMDPVWRNPPRGPRPVVRRRWTPPLLPWPTLQEIPGNMYLLCEAPGARRDAWTESEYGFGCGQYGLTERNHFGVPKEQTGQRTYLQLNGPFMPLPIIERVQVAAVYLRTPGTEGPNTVPETRRGVVLLPELEPGVLSGPQTGPSSSRNAWSDMQAVVSGWTDRNGQPFQGHDSGEQVPGPDDGPEVEPSRTTPDVIEFELPHVVEVPNGPAPGGPGPNQLPGEQLPGWVADPGPGINAPSGPGPSRNPGTVPGRVAPGSPSTTAPSRTYQVHAPARPAPGIPVPVAGVVTPTLPQVPAPPGGVHVVTPPGAFGPTITFGGPGYTGPHRLKPPGPREKERKVRWAGGPARITRKLRRGVNATTEVLDALDCGYGALPKALRWEIQRADWAEQRAAGKKPCKPLVRFDDSNKPTLGTITVPGLGPIEAPIPLPAAGVPRATRYADPSANCIQPLSPQDKARALYRHFDQMDMDDFLKCLLGDQIEDYLIGRTSQIINEAWLRNFRNKLVGIETGMTF